MGAITRSIAVSLCTALAGCTTQIRVEPITDPTATGAGIVYFLPMAEYEIALTRQLTRCDSYDANTPRILQVGAKLTATLTSRYIQDPMKGFLLQYDALSGPTKTTDVTVALYENGTLKSINAEATDETRQIIANVVSGISSLGLSSAGIFPGMNDTSGTPEREICPLTIRTALSTLDKSDDLIATLEDEIVTLRTDIQDNLKDPKKLKVLRAALAKAEAGLAAQVKQRKSALEKLVDTQVYIFRPTASKQNIRLEPSDALRSKWFTAAAIQKGDVVAAIMAATSAEGGPTRKGPQSTVLCPSDWSSAPCQPIYFRQPAAGLVRICKGAICYDGAGIPVADAQSLLVAASSVPQLGVESTLLFRNGPFESNSLKVTFLPSGGIEQLQAKTKASATEATAAFKETAEAVAKFKGEKRNEDKQKLNDDTDKLKAEKAKVDALLDLEKSRKALDAYRAQ